jgi:replicative DNA helicase
MTATEDPVAFPSASAPPHSLEAEEALLGAILLAPSLLKSVCETLRPEDFYRECHRSVFAAMLQLADMRAAVDVVSVVDLLCHNGADPPSVGWAAKVDGLSASCPAAAHAPQYAAIVKRNARSRHLLLVMYEAQAAIRAGEPESAAALMRAV